MRVDPVRYGPSVIYRYSCFLRRIPRTPEFDPIRRKIEGKLIEAKRMSGDQGADRASREVVLEIGSRSSQGGAGQGAYGLSDPRITCRFPAPPVGGKTRIDLDCKLSLHGEIVTTGPATDRTEPAFERGRSFYPDAQVPQAPRAGRRYVKPLPPPGPQSRLAFRLGGRSIFGRLVCDGDRDMFGSMRNLDDQMSMNRLAVSPALSFETRLGGSESRTTLTWDLKGAIFNGEGYPRKSFSFGGREYSSHDYIRCRLSTFATSLYIGLSPKRTGERFRFQLGLKYQTINALVSGDRVGKHTEAYHIPTIVFGVRFRTQIAKGFSVCGTFRPGVMIWTNRSGPMKAANLDAGVDAFIRISERVELVLGWTWEGTTYALELSDHRDKKANVTGNGYFLGIRANF
jgi:hypothetical protein